MFFDSAFTQGTYLMKNGQNCPWKRKLPACRSRLLNYTIAILITGKQNLFSLRNRKHKWVSFEKFKSKQASFRLRKGREEIKLHPCSQKKIRIDLIAANDYLSSLSRVQYWKEIGGINYMEQAG